MTSMFHVAMTGSDSSDGSQSRPFRTINQAADLAQAGDTVVVHEGEYREWVRPRRGGLSDQRRITYEAAAGEHVVIKGSEPVTGWEAVERDACGRRRCRTRCSARSTRSRRRSTGTGSSTRARTRRRSISATCTSTGAASTRSCPCRRCRIRRCVPRCSTTGPGWLDRVRDPEQTRYVWYADGRGRRDDDLGELPGRGPERGAGRDQRAPLRLLPDRAPPRLHHGPRLRDGAGRLPLDAAHRRPARPHRPQLGQGLDHRGQRHPRRQVLGHLDRQGGVDGPQLRDRRAATSRATSTSWSRCSRHARSGGTRSTSARTSSGATRSSTAARTASSATSAASSPRSRTTTSTTSPSSGSSTATRSAASSCTRPSTWSSAHNRIHDCSLGTWLDWQTQGTRISRNVYYANNRDLFVEVSHGPYLVEHNVLASAASLELFSQGGAFVNNLVCGTLRFESVMDRATPVPRPAQHAGRRLRGHLRRRRPLRRQRLPRRRPRPGLRARDGLPPDGRPRHRRRTTATRPRSRTTSRASTSSPPGDHQRFPGRAAARLHPRQRLRRRGPPVGQRAGRPRPRRRGRPSASSTRATRSTCRPSCPRTSTAPASASSPGWTSSTSASPTPTSRSATAVRRSWTSTWSASGRSPDRAIRPARSPPSPPAPARVQVW